MNYRNVRIECLEVCLLAFTGGDRLIEIIADVFPRAGAVSKRVTQEIGAGEIGWAPTSEIDFLIAPVFSFADLAIESDCHLASSA